MTCIVLRSQAVPITTEINGHWDNHVKDQAAACNKSTAQHESSANRREEWLEEMTGPDNNISNKTQGTCLYLLSGHEIPHELNV